jgi:hypothetical protein
MSFSRLFQASQMRTVKNFERFSVLAKGLIIFNSSAADLVIVVALAAIVNQASLSTVFRPFSTLYV